MPQALSQYINMGRGRLDSSHRVLYTTPAGSTAVLREILLGNVRGENGLVNLHITAPGEACSAENQILSRVSVERDETRFITLAASLPAGWSVCASAPAGSRINILASGLEVANG